MQEIEDETGHCSQELGRTDPVNENTDKFESMSNQDHFDSKEESMAVDKSKNIDDGTGKPDKESIEGVGYERQNSDGEQGPKSQGQYAGSAP